jgi:membrane protein YdbS with pleckstrin-like domain
MLFLVVVLLSQPNSMQLTHIIKQKAYETIAYKLHRHPITFFPIIFLFLVLMGVPFGVYFVINDLFPVVIAGPIIYPIGVLLASAYFLSVYLLFYVRFIDYYLDLWIVTNDRIIDIEQHGLFTRTVTEIDLFRIQDVTVEIHGVFATLFNYGNVTVQTASSTQHIVFYNVSDPNEIRRELVSLSDEDRKYHNHEA